MKKPTLLTGSAKFFKGFPDVGQKVGGNSVGGPESESLSFDYLLIDVDGLLHAFFLDAESAAAPTHLQHQFQSRIVASQATRLCRLPRHFAVSHVRIVASDA